MAKHRPIQERMAELQAQMSALQAKQNKKQISSDPKVKAIDKKINELNKAALKWKRWNKEAEQKVSAFEARVAEWVTRGEQADAWLAQYQQDLAALKEERNLIANEVAKGM